MDNTVELHLTGPGPLQEIVRHLKGGSAMSLQLRGLSEELLVELPELAVKNLYVQTNGDYIVVLSEVKYIEKR